MQIQSQVWLETEQWILLFCARIMTELERAIYDYRGTRVPADRLKYAAKIVDGILPRLNLFIFGRFQPSDADDVLNETLKAIAVNLQNFRGETEEQFFAWCYRIARNKINDHHRKQYSNRMEPFPLEEIRQLVEASQAGQNQLSPGDRLDLEHAMNLLEKSKPKCCEFLWSRFVIGLKYQEMAKELNLKAAAVRMRVERCLSFARELLAS